MRTRTVALTLALLATLASPAAAKLGPHATNRQLASEFLRLLKAKDMEGVRAFLSPAFILQRPDGTWLTKKQYLANPAQVTSYKVTDIHGRQTGDVRVLRYTVQTDSIIDGKQVTGDPVPRLSTYILHHKAWQIVSHANFTAIPKR